jgi:hypothetical protein
MLIPIGDAGLCLDAHNARLGDDRSSGGSMRYAVDGLLLAAWICCATLATAGVPSLDENCRDGNNRPVPVRYDTGVSVFAEARLARPGSPSTAPVIIHVNPDVYFVGRETQQWLYQRQCVHIRQNHSVVRDGERGLRLADEEQADCAALAVAGLSSSASSSRALRASIESDMQRASRDGKWHRLLPGPQRRISLDRCPG